MRNFLNRNGFIIMVMLAITSVLFSCTKMDDYKAYVKGGEISYTGKVDSLIIFPGHNRVLVKGLFISDPKVKTCRIFWNNHKDSVIVQVQRTEGVDTLNTIISGLEEGVQNFEIITYDALLNPSIITRASANVYGERYEASLINRPIAAVELGADEKTTIDWGDIDKTTGVLSSQLVYTKIDDSAVEVKVPLTTVQTLLPSYKYGSSFKYKTGYLPDTLCIDTFYTAYQDVNVKTNVTNQYIVNPGPFTKTDAGVNVTTGGTTTNWGKLTGWTTNNAVNNWNGYGSWVFRQNVGTMSMEAGKNANTGFSFNNGKIYQSVMLPAGAYTFEVVVANVSSSGAFYVAAAEGNILPDIDNMASQALAYVSFNNIATQSISFVLAQDKMVSFGLVGSVVGTSTTNQYVKITSVRLKYLKN